MLAAIIRGDCASKPLSTRKKDETEGSTPRRKRVHHDDLGEDLLNRYRSVFLSDLHLGTRWSRPEQLGVFLGRVRCDFLYLVGDIIDGWKVSRLRNLSDSHRDILKRLGTLARESQVTFIPGNHDEFLDRFLGLRKARMFFRDRAFHRTADGRCFLVSHGDEFDPSVRGSRFLNTLAGRAYELALWFNAALPLAERRRRSIAGLLKRKFKSLACALSGFERKIIAEAKRAGLDGVICGHLHNPFIRDVKDVLLCNCGDWVEHRSALVEHFDGRLEVLNLDEAGSLIPGRP